MTNKKIYKARTKESNFFKPLYISSFLILCIGFVFLAKFDFRSIIENKITFNFILEENGLALWLEIFVLISSCLLVLIILFYSFMKEMKQKYLNDIKNLDRQNFFFKEYFCATSSTYIITKSDLKGNITFVNENFCKLTGYSFEEVINSPHSILRHPENSEKTFEKMWLDLSLGRTWKGVLKNRKKDGRVYFLKVSIIPILDDKNSIIEYVSMGHDVTKLVKYKQVVYSQNLKDSLTKLKNKNCLLKDIQENYKASLAVMNINKFDLLKQYYGEHFVNLLLCEVAKLIKENSLDTYEIYRLDEDNFAILSALSSKEAFENTVLNLNEKLLSKMFVINEVKLNLSCTFGISYEHNNNLLSTAEFARNYAKRLNKRVLVYSKELNIEENFKKLNSWDKLNKVRA